MKTKYEIDGAKCRKEKYFAFFVDFQNLQKQSP